MYIKENDKKQNIFIKYIGRIKEIDTAIPINTWEKLSHTDK